MDTRLENSALFIGDGYFDGKPKLAGSFHKNRAFRPMAHLMRQRHGALVERGGDS
jgi:hypothetical protein